MKHSRQRFDLFRDRRTGHGLDLDRWRSILSPQASRNESARGFHAVNPPRPILVTGSHRSGTTWVGRMIGASPEVGYVHEPFNVNHDMGLCRNRFDRWFTYICERNEQEYLENIKDTIEFRYHLLSKLKHARRPGDFRRAVENYIEFSNYRGTGIRPLLKDPIAVFSAEWLSSKFDMDTVVMIRHPAAFAGSLKVKKWKHPFADFLEQPCLMEEHLHPFEDEIRYFAEGDKDIVDQAALLWKLIHYMISKFRKNHPEWIYVRHEDLSRNPVHGFRYLFDRMGLEFTDDVSQVIEKHSSGTGSSGSHNGYTFNNVTRDSASNISSWQGRLTPLEVRRVKSRVDDISRKFYSEEEWRLDS